MRYEINPDDHRAAERIERVSALCVRFPGTVGRAIVGRYPIQWNLTNSLASDIPDWNVALGDPRSGRFPRNYRSAALLTANRDRLEWLAEHHRSGDYQSRVAVAFSAGDAVLAAELPHYRPGAKLPDPNALGLDWSVIMGVGSDPLNATMGVLTPSNHFVGMGGRQYANV